MKHGVSADVALAYSGVLHVRKNWLDRKLSQMSPGKRPGEASAASDAPAQHDGPAPIQEELQWQQWLKIEKRAGFWQASSSQNLGWGDGEPLLGGARLRSNRVKYRTLCMPVLSRLRTDVGHGLKHRKIR